MRSWLKLLMAFVSAFALMLAVRALAFSIHGVTGDGLAPHFKSGDCLLVNRCCYGLRIEGNGLLPYSRLMRRPVHRGDIVVFEAPDSMSSGLLIARCTAVPGDTIQTTNGLMTIPGLKTCAKADYYWLEALSPHNPADSRHLGFIPESNIVGRVVTVLYNRKNLWLHSMATFSRKE